MAKVRTGNASPVTLARVPAAPPRALDLTQPGLLISPTRLTDLVLSRLTMAISSGQLKPGDALPSEGQIATAYGVSKQIAREAIRELSAIGVIRVQQGKVSRVCAVNGEPLTRIYRFATGDGLDGLMQAVELRRILEPAIAGLAAERRTVADLDVLDGVLARMEASIGDNPAWIEADLAFHAMIARMARNRLIMLQLEGLEPVIRGLMERFNQRRSRNRADWQKTMQRHARIVSAIRKRSHSAAVSAMNAHFAAADAAIEELRQHGDR